MPEVSSDGSSPPPVRVVIADDHRIVRDAIAAFLNDFGDIEVVAAVSDGAQALDAVTVYRPDVLLCDFEFADGDAPDDLNGAGLLVAFADRFPDLAVVTLTGYGNPAVITVARQAGAAGFLRKSVEWEEIATAVRVVAAGGSYVDAASRQVLEAAGEAASRVTLSRREREVLTLIAEGLTGPQIAEELVISPATVKHHVDSVLAKLRVPTRAAAVTRGWELNLLGVDRFQPRPEPA